MTQKDKLQMLIGRFVAAKKSGSLDKSSEETIRTWINELLGVFGWNVQDTRQIQQEQTLQKHERERLKGIGSTNIRPDYTLVNGKIKLAFIDAKGLGVDISHDKSVAFQIRSYGWSVGARFSIVTNFETMAIYDCTCMPSVSDPADYGRLHFLTLDNYVENFDTIVTFLDRQKVIDSSYSLSVDTSKSIDGEFARMLSQFRISLAKSILAHDQNISISLLSLFVQIIINRILFIRVCEARGLEEDGLLQEFSKDGFWESFRKCSYIDFYEHYDGPMFKRIGELQSLTIDNEVFDKFLSNLYYPSPYRFDVIPLKSISDIYDLFLGYRMTFDGNRLCDELRPEFRKSNGAVTTPMHIVEKVIECTMPKRTLADMDTERLTHLRVLDPACGSGVFLVAVYDYISNILSEKIRLTGKGRNGSSIRKGNDIILTLECRKEIINNCLYGIDINPEAVEVARMSLSLKAIDDCPPSEFEAIGLFGGKILRGIGTNIRCGNTLVEPDIMELFPEIQKSIKEIQHTNAFSPEREFAGIFDHGGFDYVIGNPPYVEVKNYNIETPSMASYIKRVYNSSHNGKIDLAIPFIERGIRLLNGNGRLGYIIQKRFFRTDYGKGIRKLLCGEKLLNMVYDYKRTDLFYGNITYVAVIVCSRRTEENDPITYISSDKEEVIHIPQAQLTATPWIFENAKINGIRARLASRLGTLRDACNVKVGLQMLWDAAYHIYSDSVTDGIIHGRTTIDNDVNVETGACRVLLCNERFEPLTVRAHSTFALFPYDVDRNGDVHEIGMTEMAARYPLAAAYLCKHRKEIENHVQTLPLRNADYDKDEYWHLYTRANNLGAIYEKICVPMTARYPQASVVTEQDVYCDNANMFFIQMPQATRCKLYAMAAIVNSTVFSTLARSVANPQQGGYFKFNKQFLDPVPVPCDALQKDNDDIKELAAVAERIESLNQSIRQSPGNTGLVHARELAWKKLDGICDRLYGITDDEHTALYNEKREDRTDGQSYE